MTGMIIGGVIGILVGIAFIIAGVKNQPVAAQANGRSGIIKGPAVIIIGVIVMVAGIIGIITAVA